MVKIKTQNSEVHVGEDVLDKLACAIEAIGPSNVFLLVDENSLQYCAAELIASVPKLQDAEIIEMNSGEENKTLDICYQIWKTLADFKADRKALLINLGGGVITDIGGFIASTFKRGIHFINIPTTLLSQIDASVGGKTGVDFEGLKNLIGVFKEPEGVFVYPPFLKTLDKRQMLSGFAEALKHALIKDGSYWKELNEDFLSNNEKWGHLILKSVQIKNDIVLSDPFELGERKLLNFGHTIGHAIESCSLKKDELPLLHGEAIAIGMVCEAYISSKKLQLPEEALQEIAQVFTSLYPKYQLDESCYHELIELMKNDKKNENNSINFTLLTALGKGVYNQEIELDIIVDALNYYKTFGE